MASRTTSTSPFFTAEPAATGVFKILPCIGAVTFTAPCALAGAAFFAAFGAAFGAAFAAGAAALHVPSSTVTSYTFPFTVIV